MEFSYYAKHGTGMRYVTRTVGFELNAQGWDLYWTPQEFNEPGVRKKTQLKSLRFVCADFDDVSEGEIVRRINNIVIPSRIVRTRSGYHCYWQLREPVPATEGTADNYAAFVSRHLVRGLGADPNAKDVSRLLRVPESRYWSDSKGNRYDGSLVCSTVFESGVRFSLEELARFLPDGGVEIANVVQLPTARGVSAFSDDGFWKRANEIDSATALQTLSGTSYVNGDVYTFRRDSAGLRICIADKPLNAWIDKRGLIGSLRGSGPTVVNWLQYYGHPIARVAEILKELFPELEEKNVPRETQGVSK